MSENTLTLHGTVTRFRHPIWNVHAVQVITSTWFELSTCGVIVFNFLLVVIETNETALYGRAPTWIDVCNKGLTVIYCSELAYKIFGFGFNFVDDVWNLLDFAVVFIDLSLNIVSAMISGDMPAVVLVRLLRLVRFSRSTKIIIMLPEFNVQVQSVIGAIRPLLWGSLFMIFILTVWSIVATEMLGDIVAEISKTDLYETTECERCPRMFSSVFHSFVTFVQIAIMGDSWGEICVPIIEEAPWALLFFYTVFATVSMAFMNVILASVLDSVNSARAANHKLQISLREKERASAAAEFLEVCKSMDQDGDGHLTKTEILEGYDTNIKFRGIMTAMDVDKEAIDLVWSILDSDDSGEVNYQEFTAQIHKMRNNDVRNMLLFLQHDVHGMQQEMRSTLAVIQKTQAVEATQVQMVEQALIDADVIDTPRSIPCRSANTETLDEQQVLQESAVSWQSNSLELRALLEGENERQQSIQEVLLTLKSLASKFDESIGIPGKLIETKLQQNLQIRCSSRGFAQELPSPGTTGAATQSAKQQTSSRWALGGGCCAPRDGSRRVYLGSVGSISEGSPSAPIT